MALHVKLQFRQRLLEIVLQVYQSGYGLDATGNPAGQCRQHIEIVAGHFNRYRRTRGRPFLFLLHLDLNTRHRADVLPHPGDKVTRIALAVFRIKELHVDVADMCPAGAAPAYHSTAAGAAGLRKEELHVLVSRQNLLDTQEQGVRAPQARALRELDLDLGIARLDIGE